MEYVLSLDIYIIQLCSLNSEKHVKQQKQSKSLEEGNLQLKI